MNEAIVFFSESAFGLLVAVIIIHFLYAKEWLRIVTLTISSLFALALEKLIQFFYVIDRPFVVQGIEPLIPHAADPSFPSSHAMFAFMLAYAAYQYDKKLGYAMFILAVLISAARVAAHLHYITDVIGGALIGVGVLYIAEKLAFRFDLFED